mgnify:CR=1 FL=1
MALWAFGLGYFISGLIQVFVTRKRMQEYMGGSGGKDVLLGSFFGFISSSCSFSALATTKALFKKGASFSASIAFLLASTNLVIELGIIIAVFLGWQFLVGEYIGGILLILFAWLLINLIKPRKLVKESRNQLQESSDQSEEGPENESAKSLKSWAKVGRQYIMEWDMVWKDVTIGFTLAGIIAVFVPDSFFRQLFINSGNATGQFTFFEVLQHIVIGPIAAFMTFIGSMGNIPLAALLFSKGVSFGGVMAFIFSDLVVLPVLRINARYYGWRMSFFILFLLFASLIGTALALHYGFVLFDLLPSSGQVKLSEREFFKWNYTTYLNFFFLLLSVVLWWIGFKRFPKLRYHQPMAHSGKLAEQVLKILAGLCFIWVAGGWISGIFI